MKSLFLVAFLGVLLFWVGCRGSEVPNPVAPATTEASPSFRTTIQYMDGGLRVTFIPNTDVTVSQVIIWEPVSWNPANLTPVYGSADTVKLPVPSRLYSKGKLFYVDGYTANGFGIEGIPWKFIFSGDTEPSGTPYTCTVEGGD